MKSIDLIKVEHGWKRGDVLPQMAPTFNESLFLRADGELIGLYLKKIPKRLKALVAIANAELRSERVPKSMMARVLLNGDRMVQYSCIIGSIAAKRHLNRNYPSRSSVHRVNTARPFVKSMVLAGREALKILQDLAPSLYQQHKRAVEGCVHDHWRFCDLFTSSISNVNISAAVHQDNLNVKGALNVIITKRENARGGYLYVPDFNLVTPADDDSMLVYPAWRNLHGVTPIEPTHPGGYRNSLIWYALTGFSEPDTSA